MFGLPNEVVIISGLLVLGLLMVMIVIAKMYRKVGPNEALIRYGMGGTEVYCGKGALIFPMVQTCRDLSLELMSFDVAPQQSLYTKQGVAVTVEAVEQIVKEPEMVGDRMRSTCADDMSKMGLEVISFTIKEVRDKNEYITNMGRPDVARIKRDAEVAAAEADRDIAIKRAEATRASAVAKAQAEADKAYEIETNVMQQRVVEESVRVQQVEREAQVKVQEAEIARREKELIATVLKH